MRLFERCCVKRKIHLVQRNSQNMIYEIHSFGAYRWTLPGWGASRLKPKHMIFQPCLLQVRRQMRRRKPFESNAGSRCSSNEASPIIPEATSTVQLTCHGRRIPCVSAEKHGPSTTVLGKSILMSRYWCVRSACMALGWKPMGRNRRRYWLRFYLVTFTSKFDARFTHWRILVLSYS